MYELRITSIRWQQPVPLLLEPPTASSGARRAVSHLPACPGIRLTRRGTLASAYSLNYEAMSQVIPEAGPVKRCGVPLFLPVSGWVPGTPEEARGQGGAPGGRTTLRPGPFRRMLARAGNSVWGLCSAPGAALVGQVPGCGHPFGVARGCWPRGHGAVRVRAAGSIRGAAAPPGGGGQTCGRSISSCSGSWPACRTGRRCWANAWPRPTGSKTATPRAGFRPGRRPPNERRHWPTKPVVAAGVDGLDPGACAEFGCHQLRCPSCFFTPWTPLIIPVGLSVAFATYFSWIPARAGLR